MTYAQFGSIQASDYNTLVGGNPTTTSNTLNAVWSTGGSLTGYGQTAEANVAVGDSVTASKWANLVTKTASAASHQGMWTPAPVTVPTSGTVVTYQGNIEQNLIGIYGYRNNAGTQGATVANTVIYGSTWTSSLTFTHTATFANGDAARYFFNSGGQLKLTFSHSNTSTAINQLFNSLCSNVGTVVQSSSAGLPVTIAGVAYTGITKIGGSGSPSQIDGNAGYYGMTTSNTIAFTQGAGGGVYTNSYIRISAKSNGSNLSGNGDKGSVVTLYSLWDEVPDGLTVGTGSTTTLTVVAPETTYLANSWGTITVAGSASGS
jgi:hypothetical protein